MLPPTYSDEKVANRELGISGGRSLTGVAHGAVTRRPPISFYAMGPRTEGYTYAARVKGLSIVQGPLCRAVPNLSVTIRNVCITVCEMLPPPVFPTGFDRSAKLSRCRFCLPQTAQWESRAGRARAVPAGRARERAQPQGLLRALLRGAQGAGGGDPPSNS
jgi:hypothetical protein